MSHFRIAAEAPPLARADLTYSVLAKNRQVVAVWFHLFDCVTSAQASLTRREERKHTRIMETKSSLITIIHCYGIEWKYMCSCS